MKARLEQQRCQWGSPDPESSPRGGRGQGTCPRAETLQQHRIHSARVACSPSIPRSWLHAPCALVHGHRMPARPVSASAASVDRQPLQPKTTHCLDFSRWTASAPFGVGSGSCPSLPLGGGYPPIGTPATSSRRGNSTPAASPVAGAANRFKSSGNMAVSVQTLT